MKELNKKGIIIAAVLVIALIIAVLVFMFSQGGKKSLEEYLDLGSKYLQEQDYDNAIAAFTEALKIDDMSVDAYLGLADAYVGKGDVDKAIEILETGYEKTGDERIQARLDELGDNINSLSETNSRIIDADWVDSLQCAFVVDNITLGESNITQAKDAYEGKNDYKSNLMNDDTCDTVYSMPYVDNPNSEYEDMAFGYLFSAPVETGIINHIKLTDSSFSCLMCDVRIGDTLENFLSKIKCPLSESELNDYEYLSSTGNAFIINHDSGKIILEYSDGAKAIYCTFENNKLKFLVFDYHLNY